MKRNITHKCVLIIICLLLVLPISVYHVFAEGNDLVINKNKNASHYIALTFDDGPHTVYTDQILEILDRYNIKATFFVIGENVKSNPEKLKHIFEKGHEIGNHTFDHAYVSKSSDEKIFDEIRKTEEAIYSVIGIKPKLFRPPGGLYSKSAIEYIKSFGYKCILWSVDTRDWSRPGVEKVVSTVLNDTKGGDIILFHDFNQKGSPTPEALERVIPILKERGYTFVTVSELMAIKENDTADTITRDSR